MRDKKRNDSIAVINGVIYPMASPGRFQAMFARGGVIEAVGSDSDILPLCDSKTVVLDMKGKVVMPGFTDTHCYLLAAGRCLEVLNLRTVRSIKEIISSAREALSKGKIEKGGWLTAAGWDQTLLDERRFPDRHDMDKISEDVPIIFDRRCGHIAVLNTKALEILGVGPGFNVEGGYVQFDEKGEPTGVLGEAALFWAKSQLPDYGENTLETWYKSAVSRVLELGVTAVQSDDLYILKRPEDVFDFYERADENGEMPIRLASQWFLTNADALRSFIENGYHKRHGKKYYSPGPLKLQLDGTLNARTAALRAPYDDDPGNCGMYVYIQSELDELVKTAASAGMDIAFSAVGDGAIEQALNSVEKAGKDVSYRIMHCQVAARDIYGRMADLGVMADIQPSFVAMDWPMIMKRLGAERGRWSYAWRSLNTFGITTGAGSDSPVQQLNPLAGIKVALTRQDEDGRPEHGWMPAERLDRIEAFGLYTAGAAKICGEFDKRGTLEVGKTADFVALMADPFKVDESEIADIEVGLTVVDGHIRYIA